MLGQGLNPCPNEDFSRRSEQVVQKIGFEVVAATFRLRMFLKVNRRSAQAKACGYIHPLYPFNLLTNPLHLFNLLGIPFPHFFVDKND